MISPGRLGRGLTLDPGAKLFLWLGEIEDEEGVGEREEEDEEKEEEVGVGEKEEEGVVERTGRALIDLSLLKLLLLLILPSLTLLTVLLLLEVGGRLRVKEGMEEEGEEERWARERGGDFFGFNAGGGWVKSTFCPFNCY